MNISINKLLDKMEVELMEAKGLDSDAKVRERIYAIKSLCELVLEESTHTKNVPIRTTTSIPTTPVIGSVEMPKHSRVVEEDGANGDSLFDF